MLKNALKALNYYIVRRSRSVEKQLKELNFFSTNPYPVQKFQPRMSTVNINAQRLATVNDWSSIVTNYFGNSFLDRQSDRRKDPKWLDEQIRSPNTVFILFHVDRPLINVDDTNGTFSLSKFSYEQVKVFLEGGHNCNWLFLGVEYEKNDTGVNNEASGGEVWSIRSPYSNIDNYYNRDEFKSWFAVDTSAFSDDLDTVAKMLNGSNKFFDGNFLRMMAIQDVYESSVIAQVNNERIFRFI